MDVLDFDTEPVYDTLTVNGVTTAAIPASATAVGVKDALDKLSDITVTKVDWKTVVRDSLGVCGGVEGAEHERREAPTCTCQTATSCLSRGARRRVGDAELEGAGLLSARLQSCYEPE